LAASLAKTSRAMARQGCGQDAEKNADMAKTDKRNEEKI
jgi:hypothetical protein